MGMRKLCCLLVAAVVLGAVSPNFAQAELTGRAYVGVFDKYLWRGADLSDSKVVVQPGADLSVAGFTLGLWGNYNTDTGKLDEVDVTLDYTLDLGELMSLSVGNIFYIINVTDTLKDDTNTNEAYVSLAFNTLLSPSLTVYYDWDEFSGNIFSVAAIGHELALADNMTLNLGASASYFRIDSDNMGTGSSESFLHNAELSASLDFALTEKLTLNPLFLYSIPLSSDAKNIAGIDDEILAGLNLVFNF
jgi:hypothetical protein